MAKTKQTTESSSKVLTIMSEQVVTKKTNQIRKVFSRMLPNIDELNEIEKFISEYRKVAIEIEVSEIENQIAALNAKKKELTK